MMFMMPTPPTTSEISGHHQQQGAHQLARSSDRVLVISVMSRMLKSSVCAGANVVPLAQQVGDLVDGLGDLLGRDRLGEDLVDVGEADRLRRVGQSAVAERAEYKRRGAGVEIVQRVDLAARAARRAGALVDVRQRRCR